MIAAMKISKTNDREILIIACGLAQQHVQAGCYNVK